MINEPNKYHQLGNHTEVLKKQYEELCLQVSFGAQFSTQTTLRTATSK